MEKKTALALFAGAAALWLLSSNRQGSPYGTGGTGTWGYGGTSPYSRYGAMGTGFGVRPSTGTPSQMFPNPLGRYGR